MEEPRKVRDAALKAALASFDSAVSAAESGTGVHHRAAMQRAWSARKAEEAAALAAYSAADAVPWAELRTALKAAKAAYRAAGRAERAADVTAERDEAT
ncbi:MAG: hypothetical protein ACYDD4_14795, partial [Acidimicrobiales bacterium]